MEPTRRAFLRKTGAATLGLGFGVCVFPGIYQYAEAQTQASQHDLHMQGAIDFKGFIAKEITPNDEFYITSYSSKVPDINADKFRLQKEGQESAPSLVARGSGPALISSPRRAAGAER
jgi:hypothetical protein